MNLKLILYLVPVLLLALSIIIYDKSWKDTKNGILTLSQVFLFILVIPFALATLCFIISYNFKVISIVLINAMIVIQLLLRISLSYKKRIYKFFNVMMFFAVIYPVAGIIATTSIEMFFIPEKSSAIETIDTKAIEKSFSRIEYSFSDIDNVIEIETNNIEKIIENIRKEIDLKNKEIVKLYERYEILKLETEQYKELLSINKKQANALIKTLQKKPFKEYLIAFILGIISSMTVFFISKFLIKRKI